MNNYTYGIPMMKMLSQIVLITILVSTVCAAPKPRDQDKPGTFTLAKLRKQVIALRKQVEEIENHNGVHLHMEGPRMHMADQPMDSEDEIVITDDEEMGSKTEGHHGRHHGMHMRSDPRDTHQREDRTDDGATHIYMHMMMGKSSGMGMCPMMMQKMKQIRPDGYIYARCDVRGNTAVPEAERSNVHGTIYMKQQYKPKGSVHVDVDLSGFECHSSGHGMHVHEYGDVSNGCQSMGGHFNPTNKDHGAPDSKERHAGDWGNLMCEEDGSATIEFVDDKTSLMGPMSIIGRAIVIHEGTDDLGEGGDASSTVNGNAGGRMACCIIGQDRTPEPEEDE